jgi:hypothetical protein
MATKLNFLFKKKFKKKREIKKKKKREKKNWGGRNHPLWFGKSQSFCLENLP